MFSFKVLTAIAAALAAISALPTEVETSVGQDCIINDFSKVTKITGSCSNIEVSDLTVPAGKTLNLHLNSGATLTFTGKVVFDHSAWTGTLMEITGNKINVIGAKGHQLDGQGGKYWDGKGDSGTKKPKFIHITATGGSTFKNINVLNCPKQCVSLNSCDHVTIDNWTVDVSDGDKNNLGHNTDGFDISSSTNLAISNSIVKNQDDCVAVNKAQHVTITNLHCSGGHGLSLSVGLGKTLSANTVKDVHFVNCHVSDSNNGIHIKTHSDGGPGVIDNVSYKGITLSKIRKYGVNIEQDYEKGKPTYKPKNNIPITGLTVTGVTGTMTGTNSQAEYILCAKGGCSGWTWDVSITGAHKSSNCTAQPSNVKC